MLAVASMASGLAALLLVVPPGSAGSFGLLFLLGGCSFPLYSLGIAYTNDWIRPDQATAASAALVTANGIGALAGPVLAAGLMVSLGNEMFFVTLVAAHGAIAAYLVFRVAFREGLPRSRQGRFVAIPARASATAIAVLARRRQEPKGSR
jgi:MFS family permease